MSTEKKSFSGQSEKLQLHLDKFDNKNLAWEHYEAKKILKDEYVIWISSMKVWKVFLTLTFKDFTYQDVALRKWKMLVRKLNIEAFGKQYTRRVGHSYFSYVLAKEKQKRGVLHFHALIDKPIDYKIVHEYWGKNCGFAWVEKIKSIRKCVDYAGKYVIKGGELTIFQAKKDYRPQKSFMKNWWNSWEDLDLTEKIREFQEENKKE